jgi:hypothetical protein
MFVSEAIYTASFPYIHIRSFFFSIFHLLRSLNIIDITRNHGHGHPSLALMFVGLSYVAYTDPRSRWQEFDRTPAKYVDS